MAFRQRMRLAEMQAFFASEFPQAEGIVEAVGTGSARVRRVIGPGELRPGGTVSGPVMMALADQAMYAALLAVIGPVALAVTTSFTINFLRKPSAETDVTAVATILKLGHRLAVGEVRLHSGAEETLIAHATVTYSIPPGTAPGDPGVSKG
jgi:uncharacterized protein (TIGR00369 family)